MNVTGPLWAAELLPEWEDAPQNVPGPGQDRAGWSRYDPPLGVSVKK